MRITEIKLKLRAAAYHLLASIVATTFCATLIFYYWYPAPFYEISGGSQLIQLLITVELILGPALSLVVFSSQKNVRELITDYSVIGTLQISALIYGLHTSYNAKPNFLVFTIDRFEIVREMDTQTPIEIGTELLTLGPKLIEARMPSDIEERNKILFSAIEGVDLHLMSKYYVEYEPQAVLNASLDISELLEQGKLHASELPPECSQGCVFIPLITHNSAWTVILNPQTAMPTTFLNIDPYPQ